MMSGTFVNMVGEDIVEVVEVGGQPQLRVGRGQPQLAGGIAAAEK